MDDDFNTPEAFAVMQGVARNLNLAKAAADASEAAVAAATLRALGRDTAAFCNRIPTPI